MSDLINEPFAKGEQTEQIGKDDNDPVRLALLRREYELLRQKADLVKQSGISFYKPHPKQVEFHSAARFKRRMMRAGNRFGKSHMGCAEDIAYALGHRPWIPKGDPLRTVGIRGGATKGLVVTTNWEKVDEVFTSDRGEKGKIWRYLPTDAYKGHRRNNQGVINQIELQGGSIITFYTVKAWLADPQSAESVDYDWFHFDEPLPQDLYNSLVRGGVDRGASEWFTLTPLTQPWIQDKFFPEGRDQTMATLFREGSPISWAMTGSMDDNIYLKKKDIEDFMEGLSEDEKQCRRFGIPLYLSGLVYKEFRPDVHILKELPKGWLDWNRPPPEWTVLVGIDPHLQTPHAVLMIAVDPNDSIYVFDEIFLHANIEPLCEAILAKTDNYKTVIRWEADPFAFIPHPVTGTSIADSMRGWLRVPLEKATKQKEQGILAVKNALSTKGKVYVSPACKRFIWEINRYCWDDGENKPVDKDDHMMECFYRLVLNNPRFVDLQEWNKPEKQWGYERIEGAAQTISRDFVTMSDDTVSADDSSTDEEILESIRLKREKQRMYLEKSRERTKKRYVK